MQGFSLVAGVLCAIPLVASGAGEAPQFTLPPVAPAPAQAGSEVAIEHVLFTGNTVVGTADLDAIAAPYLHRRLTGTDIGRLTQQLSQLYVDRGYVNSGALASHVDAGTQTLTIHIVEGRLTAVQVHGNGDLHESYVLARLEDTSGAPLNVEALRERFQLFLSDPLIASAQAQLIPGAAPGEAVLDVQIERARPYDLSAYVNNYRPVSVGGNQAGVSGSFRNLTGLGDLLEANVDTAIGGAEGLGGGIDWHMPFDASGGEIYVAFDTSNSSVIQQTLAPLNIQSRINDADLGVRQDVFESLTNRLTLGLDAVRRESRTWLLDTPFSFTPGTDNGRIVDSGFRVFAEYSSRSESQVLTYRLTYDGMRNNLVSESGLPAGAPAIDSTQRYWLGQGQYERVVTDEGDRFIVRSILQRSQEGLDPLNQLAVGGVGTVRGYLENSLVRDEGTIFNFEFQHPFALGPVTASAGPFFDWGQANDYGQSATTLSSIGVAGKFNYNGWKFDLSIGHRIMNPAALGPHGGSLQGEGIQAQLAYDFF